MEKITGKLGFKGEPGVSPTIDVSKTSGVTTLTITDVEGTKTATISDGEMTKAMVVDDLTTTTTDVPLSANQGKVLNDTKANASDVYAKTDTYNKTELDTKFENLCGKVLWTNPDAGVSFAAQTIQLNTDDYDVIEVIMNKGSAVTLVKYKTTTSSSGFARTYLSSVTGSFSVDGFSGSSRKIDWGSSGIQFFNCVGSDGSTLNSTCVPVAIIGKYYHLFDYNE